MTNILVVPSQLGKAFAQVYVADKQTPPLPEREEVLDIDISPGFLDASSGIDFDIKIRGLQNNLDEFITQSIEHLTENFAKLTEELGKISVKCTDELNCQDASCHVARQRQFADDTLDALSGLSNKWRDISLQTTFAIDQFKDSPKDPNGRISTGTSYADLWAKITLAICRIKSEYVDFYSGLMKKYLDMYQSYNKHVQKASSESLSASEDGNSVRFNEKIMSKGYEEFNYFINTVDLGIVKDWRGMSVEEQKNMRVTLDPAFEISDGGVISFNMAQYSSINGEYPKGQKGEVPVTTYNSWLVRFNAVGSALQSNMQSFSSRYSQANSTYNTLNKVFSETINRMGNNALDFFK